MIMATNPADRPTARELAGLSQQPMSIAGKPADVCPYCGCAMFTTGTRAGSTMIRRYIKCRNDNCGRAFMSIQPIATLSREIEKG